MKAREIQAGGRAGSRTGGAQHLPSLTVTITVVGPDDDVGNSVTVAVTITVSSPPSTSIVDVGTLRVGTEEEVEVCCGWDEANCVWPVWLVSISVVAVGRVLVLVAGNHVQVAFEDLVVAIVADAEEPELVYGYGYGNGNG